MNLWIKKTLKWLGTACLLLLLVAGAVFAFLQTPFGKSFVVNWIGSALSGPGGGVTVGAVQGVMPFDVRIDHLTLADQEGKWFFLDGFVLKISATQLLRGQVRVREIQAREVRLERLPQTEEDNNKENDQPSKWHVPALPQIRVEQVRLPSFFVGAPILGQAMTFSLNGRVDTNGEDRSIDGMFRVKRLDGPVAEADLSWTLSGAPVVLSVDLTAFEEEGGVMSSALGLKEGGSVRLTLKGTSPIENWAGDLKAHVSNLGNLECRLGWESDHGFKMRADGAIRPLGSFLAGPPWNLLGETALFGAAVEVGPGDMFTVRRASIRGDDLSLEISGRLEEGSGTVNSDFHFTIPHLDRLASSGMNLSGALSARGSVTGTLDRPKIGLDLASEKGVRAGDVSVNEMAFHLEGQVNGRDPGEPKTWNLKGDGRVQGLRVEGEPGLPDGGPMTLRFDAEGLPGGMIEVKDFQLANADLKLGLRGVMDIQPGQLPSFRGTMEGSVPDLARYSNLIGVELGGKTGFSADVAINGAGSLVSATIKGTVQGLTSTLPIVRALTEKGVRYNTALTVAEGGSTVALTGLKIDSERVKIQGEARADLTGDQTDGRFQVAVPELAFLSQAAGTQLDGSLTSNIQIHGPLSGPTLTAGIKMEPIGVSGLEFEKVNADIRTDPPGSDISGDLTMEAVQGGKTLKLQGRYAVNHERFSFTGMSLNGPGVDANGHVKVDFDKPVLQGRVNGTIEAAGWVSDILRQRIEAKAQVEISADGGPKGQDLQFKVSSPEVVTTYGKAKGLDGSGTLHDLFGHPAGEAQINLKAFETDRLQAKGLALKVQGDTGTVRFEGSTAGELGSDPFELKTEGKLSLAAGGPILEVGLLKGSIAGHAVALAEPTRVSFVEQRFILGKTEVRIDKSALSAEGSVGPQGVTFDGQLENIPLDAIPMNGFPEVAGAASGTVRISGRVETPTAEARLDVKGLRPVGKTFDHLPDAAIRATAEVKDRVFSSRVVIEGFSEKPIEASVKAPIAFKLSPFAFALQEEGPLEGHLEAAVKLETLASYFPSEDYRAKGLVKTALSLSGTTGSPRLTGTLGLAEGTFDDLKLGVLLRDVTLQLAMTNDQVKITKFQATDGEKGRLDVQGQATWTGDQPVGFEIKGQLHEFKVLRQDTITVTAAGPLAVKGSTKAMGVSGDLVLAPVEIRIPDQFPPEVVPLEVIEVHGDKSEEAMQETKPEKSSAFPIALDLNLKMPERLFLRGRGLDSEWAGRLRIRGQAERPKVTGNLSVVRGTANVLGKVFKLTSGSVDFDGAFPPSPQLDLVAEKKGADLTARIHASGSLSSFSLKLESDPPLPSDEILSHVLFGKSTTEISPFQALTLAQSVSELSGQKSFGLFDRTRQMLGLDQLGVTQSDSAQGETAVSVGKYVNENVYLQAEKTVTGQGGKVGAAVDVTRNIKLDTAAGPEAAEVGVIWQWDY